MCLMKRLLPTGEQIHAQCPTIQTKPEEYQRQLLRIGRANPDMTLGEFAHKIKKNVWWLFEKLLMTPPQVIEYPATGHGYKTRDGVVHIVAYADSYSTKWTDGSFSFPEDLKKMEKL